MHSIRACEMRQADGAGEIHTLPLALERKTDLIMLTIISPHRKISLLFIGDVRNRLLVMESTRIFLFFFIELSKN